MGNTIGSKRAAKVMKINGETMKFKIPIQARDVIENHPGHVLLESEAVKHFGIRAKPLDLSQELKPKRLYFLVEFPQQDNNYNTPRRVRSSGIHMTAKDRLENLMLSKRSASDLSNMKPAAAASINYVFFEDPKQLGATATTRLKMRIPKSDVEKLMMQCKDEDDVAAKIVDFCLENHTITNGRRRFHFHGPASGTGKKRSPNFEQHVRLNLKQEQENGIIKKSFFKSHEKRVAFRPMAEEEIHLGVAS